MFEHVKRDWLSNIRGDVLAGIVVALALVPEAIAFSIIAGVDPKVGLYASFCIIEIISGVYCNAKHRLHDPNIENIYDINYIAALELCQ